MPRLSRRHEPATAPTIAELAALAARAHSQPGLVRIDKSAEWLAWRYSDATCENYEWVVERDAGGPLTAAALLGERDPAQWGADFAGIFRVHELFALDEQAVRSVLRRSVDAGPRRRRPEARRARQGSTARAGSRGQRLRPRGRRPMTAISNPSKAFGFDTYDFDRWRVITGDMDFF